MRWDPGGGLACKTGRCGTRYEALCAKDSSTLRRNGGGGLCPISGSGSETVAYLRLIDSCITQLKAQGPSRTCNESKEEEKHLWDGGRQRGAWLVPCRGTSLIRKRPPP